METVNLKNGTVELKPVVIGVMMHLQQMAEDMAGWIAIYELVQLCKNPSHKIFSTAQSELLESHGLMSGGQVHSSVQNVVLSAVTGKDFDMSLGDPIAQ